ncbi:MAG: hypothetical protein R6X34_24200 [Chloroflexota bacterium]
MTLFVGMLVIVSLFCPVGPGRDNRFGRFSGNKDQQIIGIIGFVGNSPVKFISFQQRLSLGNIMSLTTG